MGGEERLLNTTHNYTSYARRTTVSDFELFTATYQHTHTHERELYALINRTLFVGRRIFAILQTTSRPGFSTDQLSTRYYNILYIYIIIMRRIKSFGKQNLSN